MSKELHINTILAQAGIKSDEATGALVTPLHFSTTYQHPEFGRSTGFDYTRTKNPTRSKAEEVLATIESADYALATSSGMSAIVLAFSGFPVGSKVLAVRDLYGGSFRWFNQVEQEGRFHFTYANTEEELIAELEKDVDVLYIETPTNPLMLEFDIEKLAKLAHAKGAKVVVDNTFYSPIYQRPIEDGADIVLHSATKYLAGHNDVLAGVVVTNSLELYEKLFYNLNTTGAVLSPFDSYQLLRGLKTLSLRMERSTANAQEVVAFLKDSPAVKEVLYTGRGGMISFKVADETRIPHILNSLKVFSFAESLGGVESLITYPTTQTHADIPAEVRHSYDLTDDLLRLSIGIEDARDLIADLRQAIEG
ncbi:cystathionine gamma-synthase [Streptococcus pneumoniae]|uniref:cystathionine gamma-synthase n=1 Tax=Streptococcus pneumoniae TaxID=1313 RepID=UPI00303A1E96|nr:cystathionine gamma-synthase [Streptococcus pneumoniae]HEW4423708.1 cystathionine gamma-synthase [Streptococcus pneumoniae]